MGNQQWPDGGAVEGASGDVGKVRGNGGVLCGCQGGAVPWSEVSGDVEALMEEGGGRRRACKGVLDVDSPHGHGHLLSGVAERMRTETTGGLT
jgi:hypothetical protein